MATTSKPKRSKIEALIIIAIFIASAVVAGFAMVRDAAGVPPELVIESQPPEPVIDGDTVFVNDTKVFLSATPHTLNMSTWVEIHLISKLFTGQIDVAFGFNTSNAVPLKAEQWTGSEWIPWTPEFERVDLDFMGMDRWIVLRNRTVDAGTEYAIRIWMELIFNGGNSGKYFFGVKPTSLTVAEAISANKLYFVDPWWSTHFGFRQKLTFDNSGQSEDLINFPVLVNLTDANFDHSITQAAGQDIRFIDADNSTSLDYEIEHWDPALNLSSVWVQVPQIDGGSDTDHIWMYYGNSTIGDNQDVEGTWDSNFMMVQHFQEATNSTVVDSTGNDNDGTPQPLSEPAVSVTAHIDGGLDFDGVADNINVTHSASLNPTTLTLEVWANFTASSDFFMDKRDSTGHGRGYILLYTAGQWQLSIARAAAASDQAEFTDTPTPNVFHYFVGVHNGTAIKVYVNGTKGDDDPASATFIINTDPLILGSRFTNASWTDGTLDEMRISNISRSDNWIAAQYLSMTDVFITYSGEVIQFFEIVFIQTGIPATSFKDVVTINGTTYEVGELPFTFNVNSTEIVVYSFIDPVGQTQNLEYILTNISGGTPTQTLRDNTFTPTNDGTITATYSGVGNPVFPIIFIGVFVAILLAILGVYVKTKKKGK